MMTGSVLGGWFSGLQPGLPFLVSTSRAVRELTKAGLVEVDKQQIRILNRDGLAERANLHGN